MNQEEVVALAGRAPHGARGLKLVGVLGGLGKAGRAPHGARGLKPECRHTL